VPRRPTHVVAVVAAATLVLGFAVAEVTGVRAIGGAVLLAGAAWCAVRWRRLGGPVLAAALLVVMGAAFVVSHVVAGTLGAWPSVLLASAVTGLTAAAAADAVSRPAARRPTHAATRSR
jgi:hypothetical protein